MRELTNPDGQKINYNYYGDGLRANKDIDGQITNFTYDGQNIILETDNTGLPVAKNFFGKQLVSRQTNDDTYYYLFNGHGDVTQLLNQKGDIVKDYEYDPFGKNIETESPIKPGKISTSIWRNEVENTDNPFQYAGEYQDKETGYYYLRARYYDPQIQRFISKDSYSGSITDPLSLNLYSYCSNNPIRFVDPLGHAAKDAVWNSKSDNQKTYLINMATSSASSYGQKEWAKSQLSSLTCFFDNEGKVYSSAEVWSAKNLSKVVSYQTREEWGASPSKQPLKPIDGNRADYYDTIVIHHTERPQNESMKSLQRSFLNNPKYNDVGYHFVIGADGTVYEGRSLDYEGGHVEKNNKGKIGIALMGNFEHNASIKDNIKNFIQGASPTSPNAEQIDSLKKLVKFLSDAYEIDAIGGHRDFAKEGYETSCPGSRATELLMPIYKNVYFWEQG